MSYLTEIKRILTTLFFVTLTIIADAQDRSDSYHQDCVMVPQITDNITLDVLITLSLKTPAEIDNYLNRNGWRYNNYIDSTQMRGYTHALVEGRPNLFNLMFVRPFEKSSSIVIWATPYTQAKHCFLSRLKEVGFSSGNPYFINKAMATDFTSKGYRVTIEEHPEDKGQPGMLFVCVSLNPYPFLEGSK